MSRLYVRMDRDGRAQVFLDDYELENIVAFDLSTTPSSVQAIITLIPTELVVNVAEAEARFEIPVKSGEPARAEIRPHQS